MITDSNLFPVSSKPATELRGVTVRMSGDSGDGMQLLGTQLTNTSALAGNDVATFPDFPAEIRAPRGTRAGVSGFQVQFASEEIFTPGDGLDALVCMNPAALITNIGDLKRVVGDRVGTGYDPGVVLVHMTGRRSEGDATRRDPFDCRRDE